jgi:hypothetical protein
MAARAFAYSPASLNRPCHICREAGMIMGAERAKGMIMGAE